MQVTAVCWPELGRGFGGILVHPLTGKSLPKSSGEFLSQKLNVEAFVCVLRSFSTCAF